MLFLFSFCCSFALPVPLAPAPTEIAGEADLDLDLRGEGMSTKTPSNVAFFLVGEARLALEEVEGRAAGATAEDEGLTGELNSVSETGEPQSLSFRLTVG